MNFRETVKYMAVLFCVITTAELISISVTNIIFAPDAIFTPLEMLEIVIVAFASVLPTAVYGIKIKKSRGMLIFRDVAHFFLTLGTVMSALVILGWINSKTVIIAVFMFLFIYAGAYILQEIRGSKFADKLNKKLDEIHKDEE